MSLRGADAAGMHEIAVEHDTEHGGQGVNQSEAVDYSAPAQQQQVRTESVGLALNRMYMCSSNKRRKSPRDAMALRSSAW